MTNPRPHPVRVGDLAPDFARVDHAGRAVRLGDLRGRWVVVFFYPKDNTPACTAQVCAFRDAHADLSVAGATVIGVSGDSDASHQSVASKREVPYHLVSDADGSLRRSWGVPRSLLGLVPGRVTYVIDPGGVVREVFNSQLRVGEHVARARALIAAGGQGGAGKPGV